jgi:hypothetical protein
LSDRYGLYRVRYRVSSVRRKFFELFSGDTKDLEAVDGRSLPSTAATGHRYRISLGH